MSGLREDYIAIHPQDAHTAIMALQVVIEKGRLNGKSMENEKLTLERLRDATKDK